MSSLIANKIKINLCLFMFSSRTILYCSHYFMCHCSQLDGTKTICLIRYYSLHSCSLKHYQQFGRSLQRQYSNHNCFLQMQRVFIENCLNSYYWLLALSCPRKQSCEYSCSSSHAFAFSRSLL